MREEREQVSFRECKNKEEGERLIVRERERRERGRLVVGGLPKDRPDICCELGRGQQREEKNKGVKRGERGNGLDYHLVDFKWAI